LIIYQSCLKKIKKIQEGSPLRPTNRITQFKNGNLEIKRVLVEDEGFYICSISNSYGTKYAQAQLLVYVAASFVRRPIDQDAVEGGSVEFYCAVNGKPTPNLMWKKNGLQVDITNNRYEFYQDNQLFVIKNLNQTSDHGLYSCVAKNEVNQIEAPFKLTVTPASLFNISLVFSAYFV
jgi:hypothetical protein